MSLFQKYLDEITTANVGSPSNYIGTRKIKKKKKKRYSMFNRKTPFLQTQSYTLEDENNMSLFEKYLEATSGKIAKVLDFGSLKTTKDVKDWIKKNIGKIVPDGHEITDPETGKIYFSAGETIKEVK